MKSNVFDIKRFSMLCRKEWLENWQGKLWLRIGLQVVVFTAMMCWNYYQICIKAERFGQDLERWIDRANTGLVFSLFSFTVVFAVMATSVVMKRVSDRKNRITWLLTPASSFEKFLLAVGDVLFNIFVLLFILLLVEESIRVWLFSSMFPELPVRFIQFSLFIGSHSSPLPLESMSDVVEFGWMAALLFSILVLGATLFPKKSILYTLPGCIGILGIFYLVIHIVVRIVRPDWVSQDIFNVLSYNWPLFKYFLYGLIPFCLILAYYRFKELEIINRW